MNNVIHVVNGDSTAEILKKSSVKGTVVVWREMLCEGPLEVEVASDEFWVKRYAFFEKKFAVSKLEYFDKTIKELLQLENIPENTSVVLWFEYDLFCQINLLALCTYLLKNYRKDIAYYLVCTGKVKGNKQLQTLSDFSSTEFQNLFNNKVKLSRNNLMYAKSCYTIFVEDSKHKIAQFNFNKSNKFKYLQQAINQHLKRFPDENGLNQIDYKILEIINLKALTQNEIICNLLIWQKEETVYGFGDLQYLEYLKKLDTYIEKKDSKYYLNNFGKTIVKKQ